MWIPCEGSLCQTKVLVLKFGGMTQWKAALNRLGIGARASRVLQARVSRFPRITSRLVARATPGGSAGSEDLPARREALLANSQQRVLCLRCDSVLRNGRLSRNLALYLFAACLIVITSVIILMISPSTSAWVYLTYFLILLLKLFVTAVGLLDVFVNLVSSKTEARRFAKVLPRWLRGWPRGHGAFLPRRPEKLLADMFYSFPVGSFMVSYNWQHAELPRRLAIDMLPEVPPKHPNKCWLDIERLVPGTWTAPAMVAAVQEAEFVFVFLSPAYLASANCRRELRALREKELCQERSLIYVYDREAHDPDASAEDWRGMEDFLTTELGDHRIRPLVGGAWEQGSFIPDGREGTGLDGTGRGSPPRGLSSALPARLADDDELARPQAAGYGAAHLLQDLIGCGGLRTLLRQRSPRINACWLATASFLCEPPALGRAAAASVVCRFAHVLVLPPLLDAIWYAFTVYVTSGRFFGSLHGSLEENLSSLTECAEGTFRLDRTPTMILILAWAAIAIELYFVLSLSLAMPIVHLPWRSELAQMPDAGLLLLVLFKLQVLDAKTLTLTVTLALALTLTLTLTLTLSVTLTVTVTVTPSVTLTVTVTLTLTLTRTRTLTLTLTYPCPCPYPYPDPYPCRCLTPRSKSSTSLRVRGGRPSASKRGRRRPLRPPRRSRRR